MNFANAATAVAPRMLDRAMSERILHHGRCWPGVAAGAARTGTGRTKFLSVERATRANMLHIAVAGQLAVMHGRGYGADDVLEPLTKAAENHVAFGLAVRALLSR